MKCMSIFNSLPDVMFFWANVEFEAHLVKMAMKSGFDEDIDIGDENIKLNLARQFFSPLITSQQYMADTGNPYSSIICQNGTITAIKQFENLYYIAVCGDGEESEWFLHRKINTFHRLVNLLFGPTTDLLKPTSILVRQRTWETLNKLLETLQILHGQEQIFLVEALERLHVNQTLSGICLKLLEDALSRANKEGHALHSLLLVNNKLLGLYSSPNAPELQVSDVLLLILLIKNIFPYNDNTVPHSINRTPQPLAHENIQLKSDKDLFHVAATNCISPPVEVQSPKNKHKLYESSPEAKKFSDSPCSNMEYHSANSTPQMENTGQPLSISNPMTVNETFHTPHGGSPSSRFDAEDDNGVSKEVNDFDLDMSDPANEIPTPTQSSPQSSKMSDNSDSSSGSNTMTEIKSDIENSTHEKGTECDKETEISHYHQQVVFLSTADCPYTPNSVDFIQLDCESVLIIISESRYVSHALLIHITLSILTKIFENDNLILSLSSADGFKVYEKLENTMKKLLDGLSGNYELQTERLKSHLNIVYERWDMVKQSDLKLFLEREPKRILSPRLESSISELIKAFKATFSLLFNSHRQNRLPSRRERHAKIMVSIREMARKRLRDFSSYLQVRGRRNIMMTAYHNDFPGLVHFVYVNRSTDQLIAPTINVNSSESSQLLTIPVYRLIKQRIWDMWQYAEHIVTQGYASFIVRDGDFTYSYFLWFEDTMGKPVQIQSPPKESYDVMPTGVLSGSFYRDVIKQCFPSVPTCSIQCYELLCMHIGVVSNRFVATSCKKLSALLWEASGEASSPIGLL